MAPVSPYSGGENKRRGERINDALDANRVRLAGDLKNDFLLKDSIGDKEL